MYKYWKGSPRYPRLFARWMAWCFYVWLVVAASSAHAATYGYRSDTFAYDTPSASASSVAWHSTGASPACTTYPNGDDDWADIVFPTGFTFTFGGVSYSSVRVYSNGILAFPTDVSGFHRDYTSQALPITTGPVAYTGCPSAVPANLMMVYWLDIVAGIANSTAGASIQYELLGSAPNRRLVISWVNVKLYNTTTRYNFQVALQESLPGVNGNFKYQYTTGSSTGANAAVGVQLTSTDYTQYAYNQNFIDTTLGTAILWYPANQLAGKSAEYRFDESSWTGTVGEVKDTSGNLQNASRTTANAANVAGGKLCRGATFTNNTSTTTIDAVATPLVPANRGSVSFWYKSSAAWNSANAMLFDATTVAARPFFLMKRSTGALRFAVTDSAGTVRTAETSTAYTYAAGTWHHIAVSWAFTPGTNQTVQQIMLDGVLVNTTGTTPYRTTSSGAIATPSTLYIGDNRTSGITPSTGSPNGANGTIDEVYVYALDINATQAAADMALTRPTCTTLDHFHIVHSGEVVNCGGAVGSVTVEAHDANHALFSLSGTTVQMSTSTGHGTWSSISTINPVVATAGTGNGSYTFSNESSVTFGLSNTFAEAVNINLNSGGVTEGSGVASTCVSQDYTFGSVCDASLNFVDAGFLFDVPNHVSEVSQSFTIKSVKKSDSSAACVSNFANTSKNLTFTCGYANPASGTLPVRVGGKALNAGNSTTSQCDTTGQAVSLSFDASGVATTTAQYADVGRMTLNAQNTTAGITITGSDTFIAAPKDFAFSAITAAPIKAGTSFGATVTAKNNAGAATPNFGKESTAEGIALTFAKYQPTGGGAVNGSLTGSFGAFTNGSASASTLAWSEVGTIDLIATLASGSYLGSTLTATGSTGSTGGVGRFIPDHFDTVVTQGCSAGSFTYSGQPFTVKITAMNGAATPSVTQNYDGAGGMSPVFAKAHTLSDANAAATPVGSFGTTSTVPASAFALGVATVATPTYTFSNATGQTPPTVIAVRTVDADNVSSLRAVASSIVEGTSEIRSGRIQLKNAYGSERMALPLPLVLQYWSGSWQKNTVDTCTIITPSQFAWSFPAGTAAKPNNLVACESAVTVSGSPPSNVVLLSAPVDGNGGWADLVLNLGATAAGNTCTSVSAGSTGAATTANAPWLQYNWSGVVDNPKARATFGIYKSPLIYRRENY